MKLIPGGYEIFKFSRWRICYSLRIDGTYLVSALDIRWRNDEHDLETCAVCKHSLKEGR